MFLNQILNEIFVDLTCANLSKRNDHLHKKFIFAVVCGCCPNGEEDHDVMRFQAFRYCRVLADVQQGIWMFGSIMDMEL